MLAGRNFNFPDQKHSGYYGFRLALAADPSIDTDGDGFIDDCDNCPEVANPDQADSDDDGTPPVITNFDGVPLLVAVDNDVDFEALFTDNAGDSHVATWDFGDETDEPAGPKPVDPRVVKEAAAKAGFRESVSSKPTRDDTNAVSARPRRLKRRRTGRIHQFATRLTEQTLGEIYDYAEREEITLAEVIEQAMAALDQERTRQ